MKTYKYYNIFKKPPNKRKVPYFVGYFGYATKLEAVTDALDGDCAS